MAQALHLGLFVAISIGCFRVWGQIFSLHAAGRELIPYEPRRPVPWRGRDVVAIALAAFALMMVAGAVIEFESWLREPPAAAEAVAIDVAVPEDTGDGTGDQTAAETAQSAETHDETDASEDAEVASESEGTPEGKFWLIVLSSLVTILTCWGAFAFLRHRGAGLYDLGLNPASFARDIRLGVAGFAAASIPVLMIQLVLSQFFKPKHVVSDVLGAEPSPPMIASIALVAIVIAPVTEEFFFRVVLQGWLEAFFQFEFRQWLTASIARVRATYWRIAALAGWYSDYAQLDQDAGPPPEPSPLADFGELSRAGEGRVREPVPLDEHAATVSPERITPEVYAAGELPPTETLETRPQWAPVIISSLIFAVVHLGNGPSPIPLFFFALMLGYLYRQTHRLWPSVVAHACLNALSTIVLATGGGE